MSFPDRATILTLLSALIVALLCVLPATRHVTPIWIAARGLQVGDTLFHEMGHTVFSWLFGQPALPMIFTLFGADQAGGMSRYWGRSWFVQIAAFGALGYAAWWLRERVASLFVPLLVFAAFIVLVAFSGQHALVIAFIGHGGSVLCGGFFLFRAWIYLDARHDFERWLNALFGWFLILNNLAFAADLVFDPFTRQAYSDHAAFGTTPNDFHFIAEAVRGWSVKGVAVFLMIWCMLAALTACLLGAWYDERWDRPDS